MKKAALLLVVFAFAACQKPVRRVKRKRKRIKPVPVAAPAPEPRPAAAAAPAPKPEPPPPPEPRVEPVEVRLSCVKDVWVSEWKDEKFTSMGKTSRLKLKCIQEMCIVAFDPGPLGKKRVLKAELYMHDVGPKNVLRHIGLSTVSSDWVEGSQSSSYKKDPEGGGATFTEASCGRKKWAWKDSDLTDVTMGNGNTLQHHAEIVKLEGGWWKVDVAPELVDALRSGDTDGWLVMDEIGTSGAMANNFVHSRESNFAPYVIALVGEEDTTPPRAPTDLRVSAHADEAAVGRGACLLTFTAPEGVLRYKVELNGREVPRYETPHPSGSGTREKIVLAGIEPEADIEARLTCIDGAGNASSPATARGRTSSARGEPTRLPEVDFGTRAGEPPVRSGKMRVWAFPEVEKVDPVTGGLLDAGGSRDCVKMSCVWDGSRSRVRLAGARGEIVAFQLCFEAADGGFENVKLRAGPLEGPGTIPESAFSFYRTWYVKADGKWQEEYAVPLGAGAAFAVPWKENKVEGQKNQAVYVDLLVPKEAAPGSYLGKVSISAEGVREFSLPVELVVYPFVMPDEMSFFPELNAYGGPGRAGSRQFVEFHRTAHAHRTLVNRLPYSQSGRAHEDMTPRVTGRGKDARVADWSGFDRDVGPLLDGSAFKGLPRDGVPTPNLYLPFHENWPCPIDEHYSYDGPKRPQKRGDKAESVKVLTQHLLTSKPVEEAFSQEYKDAFVAVLRDYVRHFEEKGWTRTEFQCYTNNKYSWRFRGSGSSWWLLDEPYNREDWLALAFFARLFKEGAREARTTRFTFRGDISRPQWQRDWMNGLMDVMYVGGVLFRGKLRRCQIMKREMPCVLYSYGSCNKPAASNLNSQAWCVRSYLGGADGVLPWQTLDMNEGRALVSPDRSGNSLLIPGKRFGQECLASVRVKALRRGQQDVEYLVALAKKKGYTREQMTLLASRYFGMEAEFKQRFLDEAAAINFGKLRAEGFARLREAIAKELAR